MDIEALAALLEVEQADRDYSEAFQAFQANPVWASKQDYLVWSLAGYADSANAVYMGYSR